ncbi:hypothetical protein SAMN06298214_1674 [Bacteroidales bacterium WCE2004]|nr:hypothetical protein SAMN06298214_1674 [Bacteroidales bacterium WCE2004]
MRNTLRILICLLSLALSLSANAQNNNQLPQNVASTGELASDPSAIMFVVDGYLWMSPDFTYEKLGPLDVEEILDRFVQAIPFISKEDIDSYMLRKAKELAEHNIYARVPKDVILIATKKESAIKSFILNGKPTERLRGIELGTLLEEPLLKKLIQKRWRIRSRAIKSLTIEGKTLSITTR